MILGSGVDLIEVGRIERELTRRGGDPLDDLFTSEELAWCRRRRRPAEAYALGFAAKEAILKALGTGLVGRMAWTDMRIDWEGARPEVALEGETGRVAAAMGVKRVLVSVSLRRPARRTSAGLISSAPEIHPEAISDGGALAAAWVVVTGAGD